MSVCQKHLNKEVEFVCCTSEWHCEALCSECIPEHSEAHKKSKSLMNLESFKIAIKKSESKIQEGFSSMKDILDNGKHQKEGALQILEDDPNILMIIKLRDSLSRLVNTFFENMIERYKKQSKEFLETQSKEVLEIENQIKEKLESLEGYSKLLSGDDPIKAIKLTYFQDFREVSQRLEAKLSSRRKHPDEFTIAVDEKLEACLANYLEGGIQFKKTEVLKKEKSKDEEKKEKNNDKIMGRIQEDMKKAKDNRAICKKCGSTMVYVSDFKKNLVCKKC